MATCPSCDAPILEGAAFCPACGAALAPASKPRTSALAIAALVLAIVPCTWLLGAVLAIVALVTLRRPGARRGRGLAFAALGVAAIWFVVSVMGAIAAPAFMKYGARSKQAEAKTNLKGIYTGARSYAEEHAAQMPKTFAEAGFDADFKTRYAYFLGHDVRQPTQSTSPPVEVTPEIASALADPHTLAVAAGNIDSDATLDVWSVDDHGELHHLVDDLE